MFKPTDEWKFCPVCGVAGIEVDESRDDYYQGPIYRCSNGHGFYAQWADLSPPPPPRPRGEDPMLDALEDMLIAGARHTWGGAHDSPLLAELARGRPDGVTVSIPILPDAGED